MPKVLRIINRLNLGGPTYNAAYLTKYLAPDFETMLLSGMKDDSEASSEFIVEKMQIEPKYLKKMHRSLNPFKDRDTYKEIRQVIRDFKPDIVHTHAAKAGAVGRYAAIKENVPVILHTFHGHVFHSYFNPAKTRVFLEIERYLAKRSTKIIAISDIQKHELVNIHKVCKPEKAVVIPLGFDLERFGIDSDSKRSSFRQQYQVSDDEVTIGIIGRLVPIKNHEMFLKALKLVADKSQKKIRAFIIGDGELRQHLEDIAKELSIPFSTEKSQVHDKLLCFTSWMKEVDIALAGLDLIAMTSFNEGTPVSLIEASAACKPIVTTDVGGIRDVVLENENALIVKSDDHLSLADKLLKLVADSSLRNEMGLKGKDNAMKKFSRQRLVEDMRKLYTELLNQL